MTTKIHLACDSHGYPLDVMLSPGQDADSRYFMPLLEQVSLPGSQGRPRKRCRYVLADKGYDSQSLRQYCDRYGMRPIDLYWVDKRPLSYAATTLLGGHLEARSLSAAVAGLSIASSLRLGLTTEGNAVFGGHLVVAWTALGEVVDVAVAIADYVAADCDWLRR